MPLLNSLATPYAEALLQHERLNNNAKVDRSHCIVRRPRCHGTACAHPNG
jgi:hypothetical protein